LLYFPKMRLAAICLLLFIAIDLSSICSCEDEPTDLGGGTAQQITTLASSQGAGDTDFTHECFCCCRHIRPERIVHGTIELPFVLTTTPQRDGIKVAPVSLYHPPRLMAL
jgi:hypothetical protein